MQIIVYKKIVQAKKGGIQMYKKVVHIFDSPHH